MPIQFQDTLYNFNGQVYNQNQNIDLDPLCNGLNIINTGTSICYVNGIPLSPPGAGQTIGDSYSVGGNRGEVISGRVEISFSAGTGSAIVVQKFYLNQQ